MNDWYYYLSGAIMLGSLIPAIFFFRFHVKTGDTFFTLFGWAFIIFGVERLLIVLEHSRLPTRHPLIYVVRLIGFTLILFAVIQKNREAGSYK